MTGVTGTTRWIGRREQAQPAGAARGGGGSRATGPSPVTPARMYDCLLGGRDHSEADARAAEALAVALPSVRTAARANRDFVLRATRWLARERGVRQFLDLGAGIPTEPALHQEARRTAPQAKVVYCDRDPLVLRQARAMAGEGAFGLTAYVHADVTDPESLLDAPGIGDTIDLGRPVALFLGAVLHFVTDEQQPYDAVRTLLGALPAGSHLVLSHATADFLDGGRAEQAARAMEMYARGGLALHPRSRIEVAAFFEGLELVGPGLVLPHLWRPEPDTPAHLTGADVHAYAGVARKP